MRCIPLILTVAVAILAGALGGCGTTKAVVRHVLPLGGKSTPPPPGSAGKRTRNLALKMQLSPIPVKLSDSRKIEVRVRLENISSKYVQLQFPTTQRIEILVKDDTGRTLEKWSEDRLFEQEVSYVGINPGEHVEYSATVATRDMQAGKKYLVEGFFPGFPDLKAEAALVPEN